MTISASDFESSSDHIVGEDAGTVEGKKVVGRSLTQIAWMRFKRDRVAVGSAIFIIVILLIAALSPLITKMVGVNPYSFDLKAIDGDKGGNPLGALGGISATHPLGVEPSTGRDLFARLLFGLRVSMLVALSATAVSVALGTVLGLTAGYFRGWVDGGISRLMDLILAFPSLLMLISLSNVLTQRITDLGVPPGNPSRITYLILIIGFFGWPYFGRIIRGQVLSLREREFTEAARSLGAKPSRILFKELLPNLWAPILVYATLIIPTNVAYEATLSYLSVGVVPPTPTLGNILADAVRYVYATPTYFLIPGAVLFLIVLAFNLFGDGLRDALDPKAGRS